MPTGLIQTLGPGTTTDDAVARLVSAIEANDKLRLIAQVDHTAGANRVGLDLAPTVEVFFGNPALGTPLMHLAPTVAIDLPQKILIIQTDSGVRVLHNDPAYLAERHGFAPDTPQLAIIAGALQNLANVAAGS
jgi:uncharacterized protein (DUF302 family)